MNQRALLVVILRAGNRELTALPELFLRQPL